MTKKTLKTLPINTKESIKKAIGSSSAPKDWKIDLDGKTYVWSSKMERVGIIREGISFDTIEIISKRLNRPVKYVLSLFGMPQTTYNKKKSEHSLLDSRNSELVVLITELVDFGLEVFNNEEKKFQRWLKKPNLSLGGIAPESLLDTSTGIDIVKNALNRIEFGQLA